LRFTPSPGVLLALPNGPFVETPVLVPISADGSFTFDVQMPADSPQEWKAGDLAVDNPVTGEQFGTQYVTRIWSQPPLVATARRATTLTAPIFA